MRGYDEREHKQALDGTTVRVSAPWRSTARNPHKGEGHSAGTLPTDARGSDWLHSLNIIDRKMPTRATGKPHKPKVIRKIVKDVYVPPTARKHVQPKSFYTPNWQE